MTIEGNNAAEERELTLPSSTRPDLSPKKGTFIAAYAGYALLLYSANIIGFVIYGTSSNQPIEIVNKVNGFVGCFPTIIVGYALVFLFFDKASIRSEPKWNALLRHSAALLGVAYLVAAPMALFMGRNQIRLEQNRLGVASQQFQERKEQILNSVQGLKSREEFLVALKAFPEITNLVIVPGEKPEVIINGLDKGIETRLLELGAQQQQRAAPIRTKTRSTFLGSLFAGVSLLALASRLIPWVENVLDQVWSMLLNPFFVWLQNAFKAPRRRKEDLTSIAVIYSSDSPELRDKVRTRVTKPNVLRTFRLLGKRYNAMWTSFQRQRMQSKAWSKTKQLKRRYRKR